jgi:hypothetical protein
VAAVGCNGAGFGRFASNYCPERHPAGRRNRRISGHQLQGPANNLSPSPSVVSKAGASYLSAKGGVFSLFDAYQNQIAGYESTLNPRQGISFSRRSCPLRSFEAVAERQPLGVCAVPECGRPIEQTCMAAGFGIGHSEHNSGDPRKDSLFWNRGLAEARMT